jgi:hypothetical protein
MLFAGSSLDKAAGNLRRLRQKAAAGAADERACFNGGQRDGRR